MLRSIVIFTKSNTNRSLGQYNGGTYLNTKGYLLQYKPKLRAIQWVTYVNTKGHLGQYRWLLPEYKPLLRAIQRGYKLVLRSIQ